MQLIVHRGTKQIGGSCVEVRSGDDRILLDLGLPLPSEEDDQRAVDHTIDDLLAFGVLPNVSGVYANDIPSIKAVVVSHVHQDHIGLGQYVHPDIPVYATEGTWALQDALRPFLPQSNDISSRKMLPKHESIQMGALSVTALPVDHSAPDAVALLVEGDGKRLLYSGDLRAHGRKAGLYDRLIQRLSGSIDILLLEGTTIGRPGGKPVAEEALEADLAKLFRQQAHLSLVFCSSQNLDRLVSIFRAVKRTRKLMVIDLYTAYTLHKLTCISSSLPQWDWTEIRVVPWGYQQQRLVDADLGDFVEMTRRKWVGWDWLISAKQDVVLLMRSNRKMVDMAERLGNGVREVQVIWSMWNGYWPKDKYARPFCEQHGINPIYIHTSGHASWEDLKRFVVGLDPKTVVPIHTEHSEAFAQQFVNTRLLADGESSKV